MPLQILQDGKVTLIKEDVLGVNSKLWNCWEIYVKCMWNVQSSNPPPPTNPPPPPTLPPPRNDAPEFNALNFR